MENAGRAARKIVMLRKIARIIVAGLELSARATAMREGIPWEPRPRRSPGEHQAR
jgi:hypothetical protein